MAKLKLYRNIDKVKEDKVEIEYNSKEDTEMPEYFKNGRDLDYSVTYSGNNKKGNFFSYVVLLIIIAAIIYAIFSTLYGNSIIEQIKAYKNI